MKSPIELIKQIAAFKKDGEPFNEGIYDATPESLGLTLSWIIDRCREVVADKQRQATKKGKRK